MAKDYAKKHRKKKDALQLSKEELDFIKDLRASEGYEELKQSWLQRKKAQGGKP